MRKYFWIIFWVSLILSLIFLTSCGSKTLKKAKEFVEVGMYEEAIALLELEVNENPKNAEAHFLLGKAYLHSGQEASAQDSFERAYILDSNYKGVTSEAYREYGLEILKKGYFDLARENFNEAINLSSEAKEVITEMLVRYGKEISESDSGASLFCFREALNYAKDKNYVGIMCIDLAKNFLGQDKIDDSLFFVDIAKDALGENFEKESGSFLTQLGEKAPSVRAIGEIKPPKLVKRVEPIYPESAIQARVGGTVILEVTSSIHGKVKNVTVTKSIPFLDQVAIDALKQWEYEPQLIRGIPRSITFNTEVSFTLFSIDRNGLMYVNQERVTKENLWAKLEEAFQDASDKKLYLKADHDLEYGKFLYIIPNLKDAGIYDVYIVVEKMERDILNVILPKTTQDIPYIPFDNKGQLVAPIEIPGQIKNFAILTLLRDMTVHINTKEQVDFYRLKDRLNSIFKDNPDIPVFIRADAKVRFGFVVELIGIANEAGFDTIGIIAEYFTE